MSLHAGHSRTLNRDADGQRLAVPSRTATARYVLPLTLVLNDLVAICAALALAYVVRFKSEWSIFYAHSDAPLEFYSLLVYWMAPLIVVVFALHQLYVPSEVFDGPREYARIVSAATTSALLIVLLSFLFDDELVIARAWLLISWISLIICVSGSRCALRRIVYALRRSGYISQRVAVVAAGSDLEGLLEHLDNATDAGLHVTTAIDPESILPTRDSATYESPIVRLVRENNLDAIVVSSASVPQAILATIVRDLSQLPTELHIVPGMFEIQTTGVRARDVRGLPLVTLNKVRITGFDSLLKRSLDMLVACTALLVLSPILLSVAVLVKMTSAGPILHRRGVLGERGQRFEALKFRTMFVNGEEILNRQPELVEQLRSTGKLVNDPRITPIGHLLRRWSLDEFPQLINVLRGQMSLVGPRMITESELGHFGQWQENLITVKPGMTGLWQVSGRSNLGYDERVRLDMFYIRSYSIWKDIEILFRTLPAVFRGTGAY